ncbi:MAG: hypothetical protein H7833_19740 [Magnetococcus sp. DMHC-1]|nr:hypothetical protein [Magnetococcales bacterium]
MNILVTFDFELFMGRRQGTVERCLATPVRELLRIGQRFGVRFTFFVDTCFLLRLAELSPQHRALASMRDETLHILGQLLAAGHELQLHLHPHWHSATFAAAGWHFDMDTFALPRLADDTLAHIVADNSHFLRTLAGKEAVFVHRGGGWSIQPFAKVAPALARAGLWMDSSVIPGAVRHHPWQPYDFRMAPTGSRWRFENDPAQADPQGRFIQIPITPMTLTPLFHWRLAFSRHLGGKNQHMYGDGHAIQMEGGETMTKLTRTTLSPVSLDGFKAGYLQTALALHQKKSTPGDDFVIIGHPKAMSPFSMACLETFVAAQVERHRFVTYRDLADEIQFLPCLR